MGSFASCELTWKLELHEDGHYCSTVVPILGSHSYYSIRVQSEHHWVMKLSNVPFCWHLRHSLKPASFSKKLINSSNRKPPKRVGGKALDRVGECPFADAAVRIRTCINVHTPASTLPTATGLKFFFVHIVEPAMFQYPIFGRPAVPVRSNSSRCLLRMGTVMGTSEAAEEGIYKAASEMQEGSGSILGCQDK